MKVTAAGARGHFGGTFLTVLLLGLPIDFVVRIGYLENPPRVGSLLLICLRSVYDALFLALVMSIVKLISGPKS